MEDDEYFNPLDDDSEDVVIAATPPEKGKRPGTVLRPPPEKKARSLLDDSGLQRYEKKSMKPSEVYTELTRTHRKFEDHGYVVYYPGEASGEPCCIKCVDCDAILSPNNWSASVRQHSLACGRKVEKASRSSPRLKG